VDYRTAGCISRIVLSELRSDYSTVLGKNPVIRATPQTPVAHALTRAAMAVYVMRSIARIWS
jgi:hypothetical protein